MRRSEYLNVAGRLLDHLEHGTTDSADRPMSVPIGDYLDEGRWHGEMAQIFRKLPLMLAFTCELKQPGDYKAMEVLGTPIVMMRGKDKVVRAFLNVCTHRGAALAHGKGNASRLVCHYHAWTYNDHGKLIGVADRGKFGDIDTSCRGLQELTCIERAGLIFVGLTPGARFDIDAYLGDMLPELESFNIQDWHMHHQVELQSANWKVAHDGYLEGYHLTPLHATTIAQGFANNVMTYDAWGEAGSLGPHQRVGFALEALLDLKDVPKEQWEMEQHIAIVRTVFPNTSFAIGVNGGMVSQLFPGPTPDRSMTIQNYLYPTLCTSEAELATRDEVMGRFIVAVRDEDYVTGFEIQKGLLTSQNKDFVFGKNELGLHRWHHAVDHYLELGEERRAEAAE